MTARRYTVEKAVDGEGQEVWAVVRRADGVHVSVHDRKKDADVLAREAHDAWDQEPEE